MKPLFLFVLRIVSAIAVLLAPVPALAQLQIAAIVNDDMISSLDVEERIQFTLATTGLSDSAEVRERMRPQIIRQLVDEHLQMQEAARLGVVVTQEDIDGAFANVNQQRGLPPGSFQRFLVSRNVPVETVKDQMRAQIGWSKVVVESLRKRVRVSEDEVQRERENAVMGKDISEYRISSIVLSVDKPEDEPSVRALADNLEKEIKEGANFGALARQFSAGSAEIIQENQNRWVAPHQLEPVLAKTLNQLNVGEVSAPIRTLSGYHLIKLHDARTVNTAQVLDSEIVLKQITMKLKPTAQHQEAEVLLDIAREVAKYPGTCQEDQVAGVGGLEDLQFDVNFQRARFRQLQPQLQNMLANLRVGDVSEPFATPDGIHLVQLCERVEMPKQLPPAEQVREKLYRDKIEMEATKRMRDLRREALIEVRS
jgi:peptidyl-prolyl cis-trans isomerase SurA